MRRPKYITPAMIAWREMFIASYEQQDAEEAEFWREELKDAVALFNTYNDHQGRVYDVPVAGQEQAFRVYM